MDLKSLTIEDLKSELRNSNVPFEQKKKKEYYVNLVRANVKQLTTTTTFSSDDEKEQPKQSKVRQRRSLGRRSFAEAASKDLDVEALSNDKLREELLLRGEQPGPVNDSTRGTYQRKLRSLLHQAQEQKQKDARPRATRSVPSTPLKSGARQLFEMSEDEDQPDSKPTASLARAATNRGTPRRRSELDRLRITAPGPKSVVPDVSGSGDLPGTPRTRSATHRLQEESSKGQTSTGKAEDACERWGCNNVSQWFGLLTIILLGLFAFLLFNGYLTKLPLRR